MKQRADAPVVTRTHPSPKNAVRANNDRMLEADAEGADAEAALAAHGEVGVIESGKSNLFMSRFDAAQAEPLF